MAQGDGDRACRPATCRYHAARYAPRRNVHMATSGAGPKADSELGWVALAYRDARHLCCPAARGGGRFDSPAREPTRSVSTASNLLSGAATAPTACDISSAVLA